MEQHLELAAQQHSDDMSAHDYFSHTSLDGRTFDRRVADAGYRGPDLGENIASGFPSADAVEAAWMNSSGHRGNILDCLFTDVGIGYTEAGGYWTVDFGD